jgi:2-keto-3-deoxy-6-phosphogluconate aldolase
MSKLSRGKAAVLALVVLVTGAITVGTAGSASAASAHGASIACPPPANSRFPTIARLRATHTGCTTARAVTEAIQAGWQANGALPVSFDIYAGGPVFHCRYQVHRGTENSYKTARCTSARKLVTMVLGS